MRQLKLALVGNPNSGKTTLFNELTGSSQYVGNWPGVTVEKKEGTVKFNGDILKILDLPGIYSLSSYSPEEAITRNCLLSDPPDVIVNIVDATNIERNLYLTTQLLELGIPIIVALNMIDILERRGDSIFCDELEKELELPIVPICANRLKHLEKLISKAILISETKVSSIKNIFTEDINFVLKNIENVLECVELLNGTIFKTSFYPNIKEKKERIARSCEVSNIISKRWTAVKLFERDELSKTLINIPHSAMKKIETFKNMIKTSVNLDEQTIIADQRYKYVCKICSKTVRRKYPQEHTSISDYIDKILINRFLAIPIFFSLIFLVFTITFGSFGNFFKDSTLWLIQNPIKLFFTNILNLLKTSEWAQSLILDGIIEGVGAVISFLPQLIILFALLSLLEDSGYMARAAFIMDKPLKKIGLSGRAFVPMLMGFGCTVPAVLGTRILENEKDRRLTIFTIPFMSCSAKMPVYALFISTFFLQNQAIVIFSLYLVGIIIGILSTLIIQKTILKGPGAPFIMELPPYRLPSLKSLLTHIFERIKDFLAKAGTILIGATIVIWFFNSFNFKMQMVPSTQSMLSYLSNILSPLFIPCGFGDWRASSSLVAGIVAKESIVSTMEILYKSQNLKDIFSPLSAYSFLIFVLLYTPCVAAISAIKRELKSLRWTLFLIIYQLFIAWFISMCVFQIGSFL